MAGRSLVHGADGPKRSRVKSVGPLKRPNSLKHGMMVTRSSTDGGSPRVKRKARSRGSSPPPRVEIGAMRRSSSSLAVGGMNGPVKRTLSDDTESPAKRSYGSLIVRFFKGKDSSPTNTGKTTAEQISQERQARQVAKKHFQRAATVLHPIPINSRTSTVDVNSSSAATFLDSCSAKTKASQGMGVTPALVNEALALAREFPELPAKLWPTLITRMDGNLCEAQRHLLELGWGNRYPDASPVSKGRFQLAEFLDEPDAHFTTSYYLGLVDSFVRPLKLIAAAPVGSYCTFLTKEEGRAYQYHTLYKLPTDVLIQFLGKRLAKAGPDCVEGAIVHENIVEPRVYASWRTSRRLVFPLVNKQVVRAGVDVPLLADRLASLRLRQTL